MPMFSFRIIGPSECTNCGANLEDEKSLTIDHSEQGHVGDYGYILEDTTGACLMLSHGEPEIVCEKCHHAIQDAFQQLNET